MSLIIGTNTYVNVSEADQYWLDRNNSTWSSADNADKEKALREATQFVDGAYNFVGTHKGNDNVLAFPRNNVVIQSGNLKGVSYDNETIPPQIKDAVCELAIHALSSALRPAQERGGAIKREKVDVIEVEYADFAPTQTSYDFVTMLLKPLLSSGGSGTSGFNGGSQVNLQRS